MPAPASTPQGIAAMGFIPSNGTSPDHPPLRRSWVQHCYQGRHKAYPYLVVDRNGMRSPCRRDASAPGKAPRPIAVPAPAGTPQGLTAMGFIPSTALREGPRIQPAEAGFAV